MKFILSNGYLDAITINVEKTVLHLKNKIQFFVYVSRKENNKVNTP